MTDSPLPSASSVPLSLAQRIDEVCNHFDAAWRGGQRPRIEDFLQGIPDLERHRVLQELIALEVEHRHRAGEAPRPEEYQARFPSLDLTGLTVLQEPLPGGDPFATVVGEKTSPPDLALPPLRVVGDYELLEEIARGGMGVVFLARQRSLNRVVALKMILAGKLASAAEVQRFRAEAENAASLDHPHIVPIHEVGEHDGLPYFSMKLIEGGHLGQRLEQFRGDPQSAARLVEAAAHAVHHAHQRGILHRDLKPTNILLDAEGRPHLTDFGLAKRLECAAGQTPSGAIVGTPSYMAPEQARGEGKQLTTATDVWALGAILYELLTGRPPFKAATDLDTILQVVSKEPVAVRRLRPKVPRDLETVCHKCMEKDPKKRYGGAAELAEDLRRFLGGEPVAARPLEMTGRIIRWCGRKPVVAGLLAALVLVFLTGLAGVLWQWQFARRNAAEAAQNAAAFQRERDTALRQQERAENHLRILRTRLDRLNNLGNAIRQRPGQYTTGKAVLEEALAFYEELLPEEGSDLQLRRQAAQMYGQVGDIRYSLGQSGKAVEALRQQADLLSSLLAEVPTNKESRRQLAASHLLRGNVLRDLGKVPEAREAYDQAAALYEQLHRESSGGDSGVELANTLLNTSTLLSPSQQAQELERLFRRMLELATAAVAADPDHPRYQFELALDLEHQGRFFLDTGRLPQAEDALRQALAIRQKLLARRYRKGEMERYLGRNYAWLGRVLAATGKAREAEQAYRDGEKVLEQLVKEYPEAALHRTVLVDTLGLLADHLKDSSRKQEVEEIRRRLIGHYEILKANASEESQYGHKLVLAYLELVSLLCQLGRQGEAAEAVRKALAVDPEDPAVNNELAWFLATSAEPRLRDPAQAVRLANKAVAAQPRSANYQNTLGVAHFRNGDDKAAIATLETAMGLGAGGNSFDWFFLAMAHARLEDRDKARKWYDRAVEWMDKFEPQHEQLRRFRAEAKALLAETGKP
jgi:serine/threonine-protein kinase